MDWYFNITQNLKQKFKSQKFENKQISCFFVPKIELKCLIYHKKGATFVCSLHNLIMSDLKSWNINKKDMKQLWTATVGRWLKGQKKFEVQ